ncbi:MAG: beta-propeller domain-containing protein [Candidatus Bathyarchaeia archaeon]
MVQKEIKKKTSAYGLVGILAAIVLVAMVYSYGTTPAVLPPPSASPTGTGSPTGTPNGSPSTSPLSSPLPSLPEPTVIPMPSPTPEPNPPEISPMKTFSSYDELKNFIVTNTKSANAPEVYWTMPTPSVAPTPMPAPTPAPAQALAPTGGLATSDSRSLFTATTASGYSTTNIQVAGVDEADRVKTDGRYIYVISNNAVYILDANPPDAKVVAKLSFDEASVSGIFLSQDGSKLAVLGNQYRYYTYDKMPAGAAIMPPNFNSGSTFISVYDVTNKAQPVLARNFTMSGSYFNSRMIGNYVYIIVTESAYLYGDVVPLPIVYEGAKFSQVDASRVYYTDVVDSSYTYTTFIALNIADAAQAPTNMTLMTSYASDLYVSLNNIYVTYPVWGEKGTTTMIYRIHVADDTLTFYAKGNVTGSVLNQYSMDEYNGYFRVATTSWDSSPIRSNVQSKQQNNVYVLNMSLAVVGKLENLGSGENLHAARFMGNRCYLVTFQKTDPLFVIDLTEPSNPTVLGELKMPGYSDYLHPYDETHLIGVGKEAVEAQEGDFAWYQGMKIALFDVSNVNEPKLMSNFTIGDRGTDSPALYDPKAFLFDQSRQLLVLPINLYQIDQKQASQGPSAYGKLVWQGAYVFQVTLDGGFVLRGRVSQVDNIPLTDPFALLSGDYQSQVYNHFIERALYIDNVLYTVSNARVQLNSLDSLALLAKIELT